MLISNDVMQVLERSRFDGPKLHMDHLGQIDRKLYADVNKVLEAAGGKWNRSAKAHVFPEDAADLMDDILQTGEYHRVKQDLGQFDSPPAVVARIIELAELAPDMMVLEPSAGVGNVAVAAKAAGARVTTYEIDPKLDARLRKAGIAVNLGDFLQAFPSEGFRFDRVLMNPPFAKQVDIAHVLHAARFVKPGGRLVSVMSASVTFRSNRRTVDFREWVEAHRGTIEMLPDGAFAESGTMVRACIVTVQL